MTSLAQSVLSNFAILGSLKILEKGIGLVSTVILARMLTPEDYGLVGIVLILVYFAESVADAGGSQYLIQKSEIDIADINSVFTLNIMSKAVLFSLLIYFAPAVSDFYNKDELTTALYAISFTILIRAFSNPGVILLKKDLKFKKIAQVRLVIKIITFFSVISLAYLYKNYWALIIVDIFSATLILIGSYIIHEYRPRFCLKKIKEQFGFSQWIFFKNLIGFLRSQIDRILIPKFYGFELAGEYHMARHLASLPSQDIIIPATEPLLSSFSKAKDDMTRFVYQLEMSLVLAMCLVSPIGAVFYFYPQAIVTILLGDQWVNSSAILQALSILVGVSVVGNIVSHACLSINKPALLFFYNLISFIFLFIALVSFSFLEIGDFALLRVLSEVLILFLFFSYLRKIFKCKFSMIYLEMGGLMLLAILAALMGKIIIPEEFNHVVYDFGRIAVTLIMYLFFVLCIHLIIYKKTERGIHIEKLFLSNTSSLRAKFIKIFGLKSK